MEPNEDIYLGLNAAADLIERRGWTIGAGWSSWDNIHGELCLEGAIQAAMGMTDYDPAVASELDSFMSCPLYLAMHAHIDEKYAERTAKWKEARGDNTFYLFTWNDAYGNSSKHVITELREAADKHKPTAGDIGPGKKEYQVEPLTAPSNPEPVTAPATPAPAPVQDPVPA